jgi:hypothetical protein
MPRPQPGGYHIVAGSVALCIAAKCSADRLLRVKTRTASDHPDVSFRQLRTMRLRTLCEVCAMHGREQVQQTPQLLYHLVGADKQSSWHGKTQYLRGLEIDDQLDFGGLLDRKVGGFLSPLSIRPIKTPTRRM